MTLSLESATVAFAGSVDDILSSTLLPLQLKNPERRIIFKIVDGKARVRMPREELERVIDEIVMYTELFPRESPLIVQGNSDGERYLLSFVCTDSGLNTVQGQALKNYRNTDIETVLQRPGRPPVLGRALHPAEPQPASPTSAGPRER